MSMEPYIDNYEDARLTGALYLRKAAVSMVQLSDASDSMSNRGVNVAMRIAADQLCGWDPKAVL